MPIDLQTGKEVSQAGCEAATSRIQVRSFTKSDTLLRFTLNSDITST